MTKQPENNTPLIELKNIGKTVAKRLHDIGITNEAELCEMGAAKAYARLSHQLPDIHLPVCYYLYSLEGALQDRHWNDTKGPFIKSIIAAVVMAIGLWLSPELAGMFADSGALDVSTY